MSLPDRPEDYLHRVGRVGRADAPGLALSLVSEVPEKVWFCSVKGMRPWDNPTPDNTKTTAQGGHTVWMDEGAAMQEVETRLGGSVEVLGVDMSLPAAVAAMLAGGGKKEAAWGEPRDAFHFSPSFSFVSVL